MSDEIAVVDVGSNSVRLVAYRLDGRAMTPFLNEKVLAGLGRNVASTGRLSPIGVDVALAALARYAALIAGLGIKRVEAVATAAVRNAADGAEFVARVARETGLRLKVLSGEEEARLSALGVIAGASGAQGVAGDLGGSSLELALVSPGGSSGGQTFPLGPLALMDGSEFEIEATRARVDSILVGARALQASGAGEHGRTFFAVGGAWRALGRIDIKRRNHPLGVLNGHEMSREDAADVIQFVAKQNRKSLEKLGDAAEKRADTLPYAAIVLERILELGGFERVSLSSFGLREGVIFDRLAASVRAQDPLVASAAAFGAPEPRARRFGEALERWIAPVFNDLPRTMPREPILRAAACRLADIGGLLHPDQRADVTFELVLRGPLAAVSHSERAFLAAAVHHRYTRGAPNGRAVLDKLLTDGQRRSAAALGAAMRLGADLSGRSDALLTAFHLRLDGGVLTLEAPGRPALLADPAGRRLQVVAELLGAPGRLAA